MSDYPYETPGHWNWSTIGEVGEVQSGSTPSTENEENFGGEIAWLTPADLSEYDGKYISEGRRSLTEKGLNSCSAVLLPKDAVLFSSRAPVGYTVIASNPIATNQGFKNLIPNDGLTSDFVYHYLKGNKALAESYASGTTFTELSATRFARIPIPLPPLSEQRSIVAKIEELFSDLDAGVADLKRAQKQLQRYRQSVLQAAVEGRLTKAWREEHPGAEPAGKLLERILEERQTQWEKDYRAKYEAKGKEPPSGWKSRYKPPEEPDLPADLTSLPDDWIWTNTEHVGKVITGSTPKTSVDEYYGGEYPFYRPGDLDTGYRTRSAEKTITEAGLAEARFLAAESTLVTCIGGTIGKTGFIRKAGASNQQINALTPYKPLLPLYAYFVCVSPQFQNRIHHRSSSTTMPILNKGKFQALPFPLPPLEEQRQIVNEAERLLSVADGAAQTVEREIKRAERLRQSILKQAFSGQLVECSKTPGTDNKIADETGKQLEMQLRS